MKKIVSAAIALFLLYPSAATAATKPPIRPDSDPVKLELINQMNKPGVPGLDYWLKVAICESGLPGKPFPRWDDGGRYAGGLGIMTSGKYGDPTMGTWERWGGEEFAPRPDKATPAEQLVVANRIAVLGWKQPNGKIKQPVGFKGWGCIRNTIGLPKGKKRG
jgi:hypothetical protein